QSNLDFRCCFSPVRPAQIKDDLKAMPRKSPYRPLFVALALNLMCVSSALGAKSTTAYLPITLFHLSKYGYDSTYDYRLGVFDLASGQILGRVDIELPYTVLVSDRTKQVFVGTYLRQLYRVNAESLEIERSRSGVGLIIAMEEDPAADPGALLALTWEGELSWLSPDSFAVMDSLQVGYRGSRLVLDTERRRAYVFASPELLIFDLDSHDIVGRSNGKFTGGAIDKKNQLLYADTGNSVSVISLENDELEVLQVVQNTTNKPISDALQYDPVSTRLFVPSLSAVLVLSTDKLKDGIFSGEVIETSPLVSGFNLDVDGRRLYMVHATDEPLCPPLFPCPREFYQPDPLRLHVFDADTGKLIDRRTLPPAVGSRARGQFLSGSAPIARAVPGLSGWGGPILLALILICTAAHLQRRSR
ncbi:MAG: hypothetical protein R3200_16255, partial [Xanthomonadales bacterium]|nr:hypothetical protein [Xanthomonadales bacterium]